MASASLTRPVATRSPRNGNGRGPRICATCGHPLPDGAPRPGHETVEIVAVTPTMAAEWLGLNVQNRKLRESRVTSFVGTLERDQWTLIGDAVVFDEHNHLLNGQHRLKSIAESGITARLLVLRGVPTEAQEVMDGNLPRKLYDALKFKNYSDCFVLGSALTFLHLYRYIGMTGNPNYASPADRPTVRQSLSLLAECPDLVEFKKKMQPVYVATKMRKGMGTALWWVFAQLDAGDADEFFLQITTNSKPGGTGRVGLLTSAPTFQLRRFLFNELASTRRVPAWREAAMVCKAWNLYREGREVGNLTWRWGGRQKEPFPLAK